MLVLKAIAAKQHKKKEKTSYGHAPPDYNTCDFDDGNDAGGVEVWGDGEHLILLLNAKASTRHNGHLLAPRSLLFTT